jgi:hypothetical protein
VLGDENGEDRGQQRVPDQVLRRGLPPLKALGAVLSGLEPSLEAVGSKGTQGDADRAQRPPKSG